MISYMQNVFSSFTKIPSASSWFEAYATFSTFMLLLRTAINDLLPPQVRSFITSKLESFFSKSQSNNQVSLKICQTWGGDSYGEHNELYDAAEEYLPSKITQTFKILKVGKIDDHKNLVLAVDGSEEVVDEFEGTNFKWKLDECKDKDSSDYKKNTFILSFSEKHREMVMGRYIPHVLRTYEAIKAEQRIVKIHSMMHGCWHESVLSHPATLDTLAFDPALKKAIVDDLDRFLRRKDLYKKVGKPWKRGYLLYGPPGTGKSSLIAAMANYLKFDVYNLELTSVNSNSHLFELMRDTTNRSIVVIEDIDCNREVHARANRDPELYKDTESNCNEVHVDAKGGQFTLSGLLNYMDGLWSRCGEERIIVFTTNHKEKLDPALVRPGRMDMHIELSFLKPEAFKILASNYLDIEDNHPRFKPIAELLEKTEVTPAVVAEQLLRNEDPDVALDELLKFLQEVNTKRQPKMPDQNFCGTERKSSGYDL